MSLPPPGSGYAQYAGETNRMHERAADELRLRDAHRKGAATPLEIANKTAGGDYTPTMDQVREAAERANPHAAEARAEANRKISEGERFQVVPDQPDLQG